MSARSSHLPPIDLTTIEHGFNGYDYYGCRCSVCTQANRETALRFSQSPAGKERLRKLRVERQDYINTHKDKPCTDCNTKYPSYVMQFDHVKGQKKFNLSQAHTRSMESILEEIDKCEVVCSNCHAERTYGRKHE